MLPLVLSAQVTDKEKEVRTQHQDTVLGWKAGGSFALTFSQSAYSNWVGGGDNAISGISDLNLFLKKIGENSAWENTLQVRYGMQQLKQDKLQKTDDLINLTTKYGYKASRNWYYSVLATFTTQMTTGYSTDDASLRISTFMAPAYLFVSAGMDYKWKDHLSLFLSPFTSKTIFVLDQALSDSGSFGVTPGQSIRSEFGGYLKFLFRYEIIKNVHFQTKLNLFSNYLEDPQNVDVFWEVLFDLKVNKFLTASILTDMYYDDNTLIKYDSNGDGVPDREGPRLQFKEIFGLGIKVSF